jgi:anti-sigma B factor antagonist
VRRTSLQEVETLMSGEDTSDSPQAGPNSFAMRRHDVDGGICVLAVEGELDIDSAAKFKEELNQPRAADCRKIVLDLSQVTFIDSTALGVLVGVNYERRLVAGDGLVMAGLQPGVLKVLEVTGLLGSFDITPDVESALGQG